MKHLLLLFVMVTPAYASMDTPPDPYGIQCLSETECFYANGRRVKDLAVLPPQEDEHETVHNDQ